MRPITNKIRLVPDETAEVVITDRGFSFLDLTKWSHATSSWITLDAEEIEKSEPEYYQELLNQIDQKIMNGEY